MSDTPETDAEAIEVGWGHMMVDAEFARRLERERDEWYFKAHENFKFTLDARAERDEAREIAKEADLAHDMAIADLAKCEAAIDIIISKAKDLINRWDQPSWKDTAPTANYIYALRDAVEDYEITKIKRNYR